MGGDLSRRWTTIMNSWGDAWDQTDWGSWFHRWEKRGTNGWRWTVSMDFGSFPRSRLLSECVKKPDRDSAQKGQKPERDRAQKGQKPERDRAQKEEWHTLWCNALLVKHQSNRIVRAALTVQRFSNDVCYLYPPSASSCGIFLHLRFVLTNTSTIYIDVCFKEGKFSHITPTFYLLYILCF